MISPDSITIIRARGRRLAKLIRPDGTAQGYDSARTFDLFTQPVADFDALAALLADLLPRPDCAVVRGAISDPARTRKVRRLLHPDPETGEAPTLREQPRRWLALDLDGLPLPAGIDARDLPACAAAARAALPSAFHGVRAVVAASASHGIKPGLRLRYWCWCDRPVSGPELNLWLRAAPVDHAVFRPAQPIYTAAPVFASAALDLLPARMAGLAGTAVEVAAPAAAALAAPPSIVPAPLPSACKGGSRYALSALVSATGRVAGAPVNSRHYTIVSEARGLARLVRAGLLTEGDVRRALSGAAELAGKTGDEAEAAVTWAMAHPSGAALPARAMP